MDFCQAEIWNFEVLFAEGNGKGPGWNGNGCGISAWPIDLLQNGTLGSLSAPSARQEPLDIFVFPFLVRLHQLDVLKNK